MQTELVIRKRVFLMVLLFTGLFMLLMVRVGALTTVESVQLTQRGIKQWTRDGQVYAKRGEIQDRKGNTLVMSTTAYIVSADPRKTTNPELLLDSLSDILPLQRETALKKLSDKSKASVILKRQVSHEIVDELRKRQLCGTDAEKEQLRALLFDEDVRRYYRRGAFLTQVLGLTNIDGVGQSGLEKQYDELLAGTPGRMITRVDGRSQELFDDERLYIEPQQGNTLRLTIDAGIQEICEKAMRECFDVNIAKAVSVLMMDVHTGEILAMCQKPDYDPNDPPRDDVAALNELMRIRLISDVYEPGSTFKVLTAAAALDSGATTPEDKFYCSAKIKVDGDTIRCWGNPHRDETMADGLRNSCNPVFVELALRMGQENLYRYLKSFGLGSKTQVDLLGEGNGILIGAKYVKNVDLARIGFGQSVAVTPVQLLTAASSVINGGRRMRPYIVKEVLSADGEVIARTQPQVVATPISEETSRTMRGLLETVVSQGGAKNAAIAGYRIGGKTGTAQVYKEGKIVRDVHIGSFFGFAPADEPRVALLVIVDEAQTPIDYGGTTAAPFARQILADVLPYLGYQSDAAQTQPKVIVPDVTGMTLSQAKQRMGEASLLTVTDGGDGPITAQMPAGGATLHSGGQVMLYTYSQEALRAETQVCVPDVNGLNMVEAGRSLRLRGLEMQINGNGLAIAQQPAAGEYVPEGTQITVTFALKAH